MTKGHAREDELAGRGGFRPPKSCRGNIDQLFWRALGHLILCNWELGLQFNGLFQNYFRESEWDFLIEIRQERCQFQHTKKKFNSRKYSWRLRLKLRGGQNRELSISSEQENKFACPTAEVVVLKWDILYTYVYVYYKLHVSHFPLFCFWLFTGDFIEGIFFLI